MKSLQKTLFLVLCLVALSSVARGINEDYRTHQSGPWDDGFTWEKFNGSYWEYPSTTIPDASTADVIRILEGDTVTIRLGELTIDQLFVDGVLKIHAPVIIADGPGIDLLAEKEHSFVEIGAKFTNNGQVRIIQGIFYFGTLENNGEFIIAGIFHFANGIITGNDLQFGPAGSLVISAPGYTFNEENGFWSSTNGPFNIRIESNTILKGNRTITGNLNITGILYVQGSLTNEGIVEVPGKLEISGIVINNGNMEIPGILDVSGTFNNNGATEISGTVKLHPTGAVNGNGLVYTGCCSLLEFNGTNFTYNINDGNAFWPGTNEPQKVIVPYNLQVNVNTTRATGQLYVYFNATLRATGTLTTKDSSTIQGIFVVPGTYINNDEVVIGRIFDMDGAFINNGIASLNGVCEIAGSVINNGTTRVNYIFQLDQGGTASGNDFIYGPNGVLIFNNASESFNVDSESPYWPSTNAAPRIVVQGAGGITLNAPHNVTGLLQVAAGVTNADNLLISGALQIETGGFLDASPVYSGEASLIYSSVDSFYVGPEWVGGTEVGAGIPKHMEVNGILVMPDSPRRCPGNFTIYGELFMNTAPGADLSVGGNWHNDGLLFPNFKQVIFDGTNRQTLSGVTTFDFLAINNPAGVWQEGNCWICPQLIVRGEFTFLAGKLFLGDENCPSILSVQGRIKGASSDNYIVTYKNSYVEHYVDWINSFQFPIGPSETSYNPITVELPIQTGGIFRATVDSTMVFQNVDSSYCVQRTWFFWSEADCNAPNRLTEDGDSIFFKLTFQWNANDEGVNFTRNASSTYDGINEYKNEPATGTDAYTVITIDSILYQPTQVFIISNAGGLTDTEDLFSGDEPSFFLGQNFPNPVNGSTTIRYTIPESGHVRLSVYDALGREVKQLVNATQPGSTHEAVWKPEGLANGIYFYRLQIGAFVEVKKMTLLK